MSNAFQTRCNAGMLWDDEVSQQLSSSGYEIGRYNIENTAKHFIENPNYSFADNPSIKFIRYFPDGIASDFNINHAFFWDAKLGISIEKNAYDTYCEIGDSGREFYLFIKTVSTNSYFYCVPISAVEFKNSAKYVSQFSIQNQMPVDENGWIAPRLWPEERYLSWKFKHPEASGTPFRYFDFDAMKQWVLSWPFNYQNVVGVIEQNYWKINSKTPQQQLVLDAVIS